MASDGSHGPRPFKQRELRTLFVRVPVDDWPHVKRGFKREFRGSPGKSSVLPRVQTPTPVVAWTITQRGHESELMVLERFWMEQLGAITPESLAAEGFPSFEEFRRYWMRRERRRFAPTRRVACYAIRPWTPDDRSMLGDLLIGRLYGDWLGEVSDDPDEDPAVAYRV